MMTTNPTPPRCPKCHSLRVVEIAYGMPAVELRESAERGEVALGGCVVGRPGGDPDRRCRSCGHEWRGRQRSR